jgi:hypothetical protein
MFVQQQQQGMALPPLIDSPYPAVAQQHAVYEVGGLQQSGNALSAMSPDFVMYTWKTAECSKKVGTIASLPTPVLQHHPQRAETLLSSLQYCHDWAVCPFAHPNENSRRRSPRVFTYSATICQQMKQVRGVQQVVGAVSYVGMHGTACWLPAWRHSSC